MKNSYFGNSSIGVSLKNIIILDLKRIRISQIANNYCRCTTARNLNYPIIITYDYLSIGIIMEFKWGPARVYNPANLHVPSGSTIIRNNRRNNHSSSQAGIILGKFILRRASGAFTEKSFIVIFLFILRIKGQF